VNQVHFFGFTSGGDFLDTASIEVTAKNLVSPKIDSIEPSRASPGDRVTIRGTNFFPRMPVLFDGVPSPAVDATEDPDTIEATIPPETLPGKVEVVVGTAGLHSEPFSIDVVPAEIIFTRGDVDFSGSLSITDAIQVLFHLFQGRPISCEDAADSDDSGTINLTDSIVILNYLFRRGAPPPAPFPDAGSDPTDDLLECGS
jgi:hypothetical protein